MVSSNQQRSNLRDLRSAPAPSSLLEQNSHFIQTLEASDLHHILLEQPRRREKVLLGGGEDDMLYLPRLARFLLLGQLLVVDKRRRTGDVEEGEFAEERLETGLLGCPVDLDADADEDCGGERSVGAERAESRGHTEGQLAEIGSVAGDDERERLKLAVLGDGEGEVLFQHGALVDEEGVDPL